MIERRIFVDGVFDLFHLGHIQLFFKVKNLFPNSYIIAGISKDSDNIKYKRKSILTQKEKHLTMKHCKYIDEIVLDSPWIIDDDFIKKHNIDYVIHDPLPYVSSDIDDVYRNCKKKGIFIGLNRTPNISTTDIIERIKKGHQK